MLEVLRKSSTLLRALDPTVLGLVAVLVFDLPVSATASLPESPTSSPPKYTIHLLGFDDPLHTYPEGIRPTYISSNDGQGISAGGIAGSSSRYTTDTAGDDAWLFTGEDQQFRQLGLLGPDYYVLQGPSHRSRISRINDAGQVIGYTSTDPTNSSGRDHAWYYDPATGETTRIGYSTFPEAHPYMEDRPRFLMENGFAAGTSDTFTSGAPHWAWIYDPAVGTTQLVGLSDSVDVGPDSRPISQTLEAVTPTNLVVGTSERNTSSSGSFHGTAVWVHRPGTAQSERIGLYDESYTRRNQDKIAYFDDVNLNGLVLGHSEFATEETDSSGVWLYDSHTGSTVAIGLANPNDGQAYRDGEAFLTESNHVVGTSAIDSSRLTWVYDHATGTTSVIGLLDERHVLTNGSTYSEIETYSESGFVLGQSRRKDGPGSASARTSAWIYSPLHGTVTEAGIPIDGPTNGLSSGIAINETGQAIGISYSQLYVNVKPWFFDPATEQTIPLATEVFRSHNIRSSLPTFLNESGQVVGLAETQNEGDIVWFYDHQTGETRQGFDYRDEFTGNQITIDALTESGLVLGSNDRLGSYNKHTPWLYDSNTGLNYSLIFSRSSKGEALSHVNYLSDDGVLLGEYDAYSENDEHSRRYFYWSINTGFHDLESLIQGDLTSLGWETLAALLKPQQSLNARDLFAHDPTFLWAIGRRLDGYEMPFALVQVPETISWMMITPAIAVLSSLRLGRTTFAG